MTCGSGTHCGERVLKGNVSVNGTDERTAKTGPSRGIDIAHAVAAQVACVTVPSLLFMRNCTVAVCEGRIA